MFYRFRARVIIHKRGEVLKIRRWNFGPGLLVTAAFVGPGTIATASAAGAHFGYALLWALVFSVLATIVLQEMAVRQAIVSGNGLAATLRQALANSWFGKVTIILVIAAIGLGNAAYESGNIAGAALALSGVTSVGQSPWALFIGLIAAGLLFLPGYKAVERVLVALVLIMSAVFMLSALLLAPHWAELAKGMVVPQVPSGSVTMVIALIGTTVVPYNLFLQANAARDKWHDREDRSAALGEARLDTVLSVALGGLITIAIVSAAAVTFYFNGAAFSADKIALQLEPVLGPAGHYVFACGLLAAGLTSAVTAPLAAAYAVCGALGLNDTVKSKAFRAIAVLVVATGTVFAAVGTRPISLILFAQAANGLLLPLIALILIWLMNQKSYLSDAANGWLSNSLGTIVVLVSIGLGANKLISLL